MTEVYEAINVAVTRLHRIAKDVEETAIGSSRVEMYAALVAQIRQEAARLETAGKAL